jgi:hypothetical protein
MPCTIPLRITLVNPPRNVSIMQQLGKDDLVAPSSSSLDHLSFDFTVNVANEPSAEVSPNFRGPFVQGPVHARFIYINSGTYAGDHHSRWGRRAKIPLNGISWELIDQVLAKPNHVLEARIEGTAKDGGPVAATVPLIGGSWKMVKAG